MNVPLCDLFRALLRISLEPKGSEGLSESAALLKSADASMWQRVLLTLKWHQVLQLVAYGIQVHGLEEDVPESVLGELKAAYEATRSKNQALFDASGQILRAFAEEGVRPIMMKGAVLADSVYPDLGMRYMQDVDMLVQDEQWRTCMRVLEREGFAIQGDWEALDGINFTAGSGVSFDLHRRFRLFEHLDLSALTVDYDLQRIDAPTVRIFEPTAMLTHLITHLDGHRRVPGFMMSWFVDFALVVPAWAEELDTDRLVDLLSPPKHQLLLFRVLRFLNIEFDVPLPESLANIAPDCEPLQLSEVMRQRRVAQWNLASLRGWLRLGACRIGAKPYGRRPNPDNLDFFLMPFDAMRERRMLSRFEPLTNRQSTVT